MGTKDIKDFNNEFVSETGEGVYTGRYLELQFAIH